MTFEEFDHVRVKGKNVIGYIVDICKTSTGDICYTVESESEEPINDPDAWNDVRFPQLPCTEDQLEHI